MAIHDRIRLTGLLREKPCDEQGFSYSEAAARLAPPLGSKVHAARPGRRGCIALEWATGLSS